MNQNRFWSPSFDQLFFRRLIVCLLNRSISRSLGRSIGRQLDRSKVRSSDRSHGRSLGQLLSRIVQCNGEAHVRLHERQWIATT